MGHDTSLRIELLARLLAQRYGPNFSLGALLASAAIWNLHVEGRPITVAAVARRAELPKQTVSRWVQRWIETDRLRSAASAHDDRQKLLKPAQEQDVENFLAEIDKILHC